jgi:hypothetical protein
MNVDSPPRPLLLVGLDGSNPLAFLAALGTLRSLTSTWPNRQVRMSWQSLGGWRPALHVQPPATAEDVVRDLDGFLRARSDDPAWSLGPDLSVGPDRFKAYAEQAAQQAHQTRDRSWADFAAAFGCEATCTEAGTIQDTALRTMSGTGHQHFLGFMVNIVKRTEAEHLEKTLFHPWRYDDPLDTQNLRWDPSDDVRRALRWRDPSGDPQRRKRGGMLGANRLAIEGLPLLPTIPVARVLRTTGFTGRGSGKTFWNWPIWSRPLPLDVVRSLMAIPHVQKDPGSETLRERGIAQVFRSCRFTIGKFRCFTPGEPV